MTIRPPRPAPRRRSSEQVREAVIFLLTSFGIVIFWMRVLLALASVGPWTVTWRVVKIPTMILVAPLTQWEPLQRELLGRLIVAELLAAALVSGCALVLLSSLANRRR
jgi:hypothetical protein